MRRLSCAVLFILPFLAIPLIAVHALRVSGVYQTIGAALLVVILVAAWVVGGPAFRSGSEVRQKQALAAALLLLPWTLMAVLWVGLATPWDSTPTENRMRYLVLVVCSIAVTCGFAVLRGALHEGGERLHSTLAGAVNGLAGPAYLVWTCFMLGMFVVGVDSGHTAPGVVAMSDVNDILLFFAGALTYVGTALFAISMKKTGWLGRGASQVYVLVCAVALVFLALRGMSYPDPTASTTPWYFRPGFIAGVPAIPWVMPYLLGAVMLRKAGTDSR